MTDRFSELLQQSKDGDVNAFMTLISPYQVKIYAAALNITKSEEEANQIALKAIGSVYSALPNYNKRSSFPTWIWSIILPYFKEIPLPQKTGIPA